MDIVFIALGVVFAGLLAGSHLGNVNTIVLQTRYVAPPTPHLALGGHLAIFF